MKTDLTFIIGAKANENGSLNIEAQQLKSNDTSLQSTFSRPFTSLNSKAHRISNPVQCRIQRRARVPISERWVATPHQDYRDLYFLESPDQKLREMLPFTNSLMIIKPVSVFLVQLH